MKRILIIEDDRKIAMALALRLKSAGHEANAAYDALTGVNAAVKNLPDLVLLDIGLPGGDGFAVAEKIQSLVRTPIPMIFITASKQPGFRQRANELGAAGYFEKPYEAEDLLAAIQDVFSPPDHGSLAPRHEI
jgi:two-component system KDP operon response regulator KdpE